MTTGPLVSRPAHVRFPVSSAFFDGGRMQIPDRNAWAPWQPRVVADRLAGVDVPWCVAGGWALELFVRRLRRPYAIVHPEHPWRETVTSA